MPIMWHEEQKQVSGKIITNVMSRSSTTRNSFFLTSSLFRDVFITWNQKKKKILFATKLSINTKPFKNRQQQLKTFSVLAIWWQTGLLRSRNRTPRSEFAAALHVCYLWKRNALPGREMLKAIRKSPHNTVVLSIHMEHLLKKKEVPPHKKQPRNKIARVIWSAEQTPNLWIW